MKKMIVTCLSLAVIYCSNGSAWEIEPPDGLLTPDFLSGFCYAIENIIVPCTTDNDCQAKNPHLGDY